jgi:hypothetical protein
MAVEVSRNRLRPRPVASTSLLALGRRHLVRARHARPGSSVEVLHDDGASPVICLVALTAGRALAGLAPADAGTALQVLQGQVHVRRSDRTARTFPGELVLGSLSQMEVTALTDCVVLVTGERTPRPRVVA